MRFKDQTTFNNGQDSFTAPEVASLGASEYTIGGTTVDESGSVDIFKEQLRQMVMESTAAVKTSPRSENVLLRVTKFRNDSIREVHGFVHASEINVQEYPHFSPDGNTPLYRAAYDTVSAIVEYAKKLTEKHFLVNAICFIITDGCDTQGGVTPDQIRKKIQEAKNIRGFESFTTILIGVTRPPIDGETEDSAMAASRREVIAKLELLKEQAGITHFINAGSATAATLAKLANFVSSSLIIKSTHMGTHKDSDDMGDAVQAFTDEATV